MRLLADLHTHTLASDGFCTVLELASAARLRGLELIAITDHGPGVSRGARDYYFRNLRVAASVIDGVKVLKGCEANIVPDARNLLDLDDDHLARLDFVIAGFHPEAGFDERDPDRNTQALLAVIANPLVDMISHPGNGEEFPVHLEPVVEAAARHKVIIELNNHSFDHTTQRHAGAYREREFAAAAKAAGAPIAIGSDAHFANRVGVFDNAVAIAEQVGLEASDIVNRDAQSVLEFVLGKRPRPNLGVGGEWNTRALKVQDCEGERPGAEQRARDAIAIEAVMRLRESGEAE